MISVLLRVYAACNDKNFTFFHTLSLVLTLVGWMSGKGSRDSGMNTTRISFLALHSFLNRSILAAASSLMGDPGLWVEPATTQQNRA